jgi:hypothetical protein
MTIAGTVINSYTAGLARTKCARKDMGPSRFELEIFAV